MNKQKLFGVVLLICAGILVVCSGPSQVTTWHKETSVSEYVVPGDKESCAISGGIGGAVLGGLAYAALGALGVASGGTAFAIGLPAMMLIGGGAGATAGAALGTSDTTHTVVQEHWIPETKNVQNWQVIAGYALGALGLVVLLL